jgi:hypothetical protein
MLIDGIKITPNSARFSAIAPGMGGGFRVSMLIAPKRSGRPRFKTASGEFPQTDYIVAVVKDRDEAERAVATLNALGDHGTRTAASLRVLWSKAA